MLVKRGDRFSLRDVQFLGSVNDYLRSCFSGFLQCFPDSLWVLDRSLACWTSLDDESCALLLSNFCCFVTLALFCRRPQFKSFHAFLDLVCVVPSLEYLSDASSKMSGFSLFSFYF